GGDVGAEEVLPLPEAHHQRGVAAGGDDGVRGVAGGGRGREGALERGGGGGRRLGGIAEPLHLAGDEVGGGLGVGLGDEAEAVGLELRAQRRGVLDDAVVHHGDLAPAAAPVGVGVGVGGASVRGPAGVRDRDLAGGLGGAVERLAE